MVGIILCGFMNLMKVAQLQKELNLYKWFRLETADLAIQVFLMKMVVIIFFK